ncbi:unnamed protein product [Paramecium sonneborni]|uniref:Uncharacterized protein n=1 Tax=Paramecium sonneborni TaxID=65129 RepID=A0A8S1RQS4_9CILI|nr:unnamed protein product [Paramecium sonneborni]
MDCKLELTKLFECWRIFQNDIILRIWLEDRILEIIKQQLLQVNQSLIEQLVMPLYMILGSTVMTQKQEGRSISIKIKRLVGDMDIVYSRKRLGNRDKQRKTFVIELKLLLKAQSTIFLMN